jgi:hypothetical protein
MLSMNTMSKGGAPVTLAWRTFSTATVPSMASSMQKTPLLAHDLQLLI